MIKTLNYKYRRTHTHTPTQTYTHAHVHTQTQTHTHTHTISCEMTCDKGTELGRAAPLSLLASGDEDVTSGPTSTIGGESKMAASSTSCTLVAMSSCWYVGGGAMVLVGAGIASTSIPQETCYPVMTISLL